MVLKRESINARLRKLNEVLEKLRGGVGARFNM
ncbi:MAG: hypothetical protein PWR28_933 [Synergistaceae bacterium]|jgi:hypothetical protein|nr:hypothetical protein [Synergistaceae bacterium]